jgi:hypothetical protein
MSYEPIIVVGPGRCGTSCVAGVLARLGVFMGSRFVPANASNPHGHWEDWEILAHNTAILERRVSIEQWRTDIAQLMRDRLGRGVPWGWKDPSTCDLLWEYLGFFHYPKFVRCRRSLKDIESSLVRAYSSYGMTPAGAQEMRSRRERELDRYLPWYPSLTIDFDDLKRDPEQTVDALIQFCGLSDVAPPLRTEAIQSIQTARTED